MKITYRSILAMLTLLFFPSMAGAKITLPSFFTDNMVLQQKATVPFWGKATPGSTVKVVTSWDKKVYTNHADANGNWKVSFRTPSYGGPYTISLDDGSATALSNILIGEVWLCSGQSNMEMPLAGWGKIQNYKEEIKNADYPQIRLLQAQQHYSDVPLENLKVQKEGWQVCNPKTIADFSSTAYFFARKVYSETKVPIGLLHSSWGGTVIEAWMSAGALRTLHDFDAVLDNMAGEKKEGIQQKYEIDLKQWVGQLNAADAGMQNDLEWTKPSYDVSGWKSMKLPTLWENAGLPDFDGVVWFRREFKLQETTEGKKAVLRFFADDNDNVWINGTHIGGTDGYNVQREYELPSGLLKKGSNTIVIRVFDGTGGGGIYGDAGELALQFPDETMTLADEWKFTIGADLTKLPPQPYMPQGQNMPTALFNAMIHPLLQVPITGVIWYQGESNEGRAHQYQKLFPLLINDWRKQFGIDDLPFYFVQLANYRQPKQDPAPSLWAELREAQLMTLKVPHTGMAVAVDIGNADDIHPKNKQEVGERLARIALAKQYGKNIAYSGPMYKSMSKKNNSIVLEFDFAKGIKATDGKLKGFTIAGEDKVFHWADAKIEDGKVVVTSPQVTKPVAVRYDWADNPDGNLTNESGLPASPFRTDDWPGLTYGKK